ncbi:MAG: SprT-like domain-containing protein [Actinomycetaceae bacterium]|nr:SprT-like domain-containing protein [Actinomycetaceae bacterium]
MNRQAARDLATALILQHGLNGWTFVFDRARRRAGSCTHSTRTISLSGPLTDIRDEKWVRAVILHEIAHALVGPQHGHGPVWKRTAVAIGADPRSRIDSAEAPPAAPWVGTCPRCSAQRRLYSAPRRVSSCGSCSSTFSSDLILEWTHEGKPTQPGGAYAKELRRLRK